LNGTLDSRNFFKFTTGIIVKSGRKDLIDCCLSSVKQSAAGLKEEKVTKTHADVPTPVEDERVELLWLEQFLEKEFAFDKWQNMHYLV
jgi:hypothetical protein